MGLDVQGIKAFLHRPETGLLVIRLALGLIFIEAGWSKFSGGQSVLHQVGSAVQYIGIDPGRSTAMTLFLGIAAAGSELLGGLLLLVGWLFRTSTLLLMLTMAVAVALKVEQSGGDIREFGYPLLAGLVLFGLFLTGPGRISVQKV